jgi:hypothetical protein
MTPEQEEQLGRVPVLARELYLCQRQLRFRIVLQLFQHRVGMQQQLADQSSPLVHATDSLLQAGLIDRLMKKIRDCTQLTDKIWESMVAEAPIPSIRAVQAASERHGHFAHHHFFRHPESAHFWPKVHLAVCFEERQTAAECLFFIAYQVQWTEHEVASAIDVIRDLTNGSDSVGNEHQEAQLPASNLKGLPYWNPYTDIPNPYETLDAAAPAFSAWPSTTGDEKDPVQWQQELVEHAVSTGQTALLRTISTLTVAVLAALDCRTVLYDRNTHEANAFQGEVRVF